MLPISLTIEGLYSYKEGQTIDFERLTSNQIFGIFGEVGSGKSSILEAIVFALYGETDRLKQKNENRHYNMMNLQSNRLLIDFHCKAGHKSEQEYRFIFESKRNSKNFEDVKQSGKGRRVFKKVKEEWQPLENWSSEEIIGMSYKNFRKTVIIPQGQFREFIEQTPSDRIKMLKEIFSLEKYDLLDKTKSLFYRNDTELAIKRAEKEKLIIFTKEQIKDLEKALETTEKQQKELKKNYSEKQKALVIQQKQQQLHKELSEQKTILGKLEKQQKSFGEREKTLEQYKKAFTYFNEKFIQQDKLQQEILAKKEQINTFQKEKTNLFSTIEKAEKEFLKAEKNYQNRDVDKQKCEELKKIIASLTLKKKLSEKEEEAKRVSERLNNDTQIVQNYELGNLKISQKISESKKSLPENITTLLEYKNNIALEDRFLKDVQILQKKVAENQSRISVLVEQVKELLINLQISFKSNFSFDVILNSIKNQEEKIRNQNQTLNEKIHDLKVRQQLSNYSQNLENGNPCPLCGATDHPEIAHTESVHSELETLISEQKKNERKLQRLSSLEKEVIKLSTNYEKEKETEKILKQEFSEVSITWKNHIEKFPNQDFSVGEKAQIHSKINFYNYHSSEIKELEKQEEDRKIKLENIKKNVLISQELAQLVKDDILKLTTQIESISSEISLLKDLISKPKNVLESTLEKGEKQIKEAEKNYQLYSKNLQELKEKKAHLSATSEAVKQQFTATEKECKSLENGILDLLKKYEFQNISAIKSLLSKKITIETEQETINNFKQELALAIQKFSTLSVKTGNQPFDEKLFLSLQKEVQELDNQRIANEKKMAVCNQEIKNIELKLLEKKAVEKELLQLSERAENLKMFRDLFKRGSGGFVDYISSVYLSNLVLVANARFIKLTHNNLSLELDTENNFVVRDYLNDGKTRLLKTLSGGQMFQAALCLALALAESVRTLNQSDKSFFFLDEGFGTLDKSSLQTVFQTLKSLKKENRIVGIISHVEELQQEVEVSLKINTHKENGSLISYSWNES